MNRIQQQPTVDYFQSINGFGQLVSTTPIVAAARMLKPNSGLGADDPSRDGWRDLAFVAVGVLAVTGILSYQAGKAMAPTKADRKMWGWVGVPVGMLTGPWGLGVMGIISNSKKD